jgi:pyrimidine 5'-nucleotidase
MADLIDRYFVTHLSLPWDDAVRLHKEYYQNYGLAIEGLVRHHQIDPLEYNAKVDDALPLDGIIKPRPELKKLLADIDRTKVRLWLFTNAYVNHARRVIRLLEIEEFFEGITYCDYADVPLTCKPHPDMYAKAMREAGVEKHEDCFFVGELSIVPTLWLMHFTDMVARRLVPKLQEGAGNRVDGGSSRRRRRQATQDAGLQVPDPASRGVAGSFSAML